ncbi:3-hydroxyacyl-CoA dehydrogenase family protein [Streptomyces sp. NPDC001920]
MTEQTRPASAVGVIGLGSCGESLLRLLAGTGRGVVGVDTDRAVLHRVARRLRNDDGTAADITLSHDIADLAHAELVVEAVPDDAKSSVLRGLHTVCAADTILVTTATAPHVLALAAECGRPARTLGLRLTAPVPPGGTVEVVRTAVVSDDAVATVEKLLDEAGVRRVAVGTRPGGHADQLVYAFLNRAAMLYESGYATPGSIDTAMRLGCGLPSGPLEFLDRVGIDTAHAVLTAEHERTGRACFMPAAVLSDLLASGRLGRKSGQGFHRYDQTGDLVAGHGEASAVGDARPVGRVGILGSGTMATGIAEVMAVAGYPTIVVARDRLRADRVVSSVADSLTRKVRRGRVSPQDRAAALGRLEPAEQVAVLSDCDLVIEAVVEDLDVKLGLFRRLGEVCKTDAVLATVTSSLPVTPCAQASGRASQVVGMHFFNPAPAMRLVEVVRTEETTAETLATVHGLCRSLRKTVVDCDDRAGFIVNFLLFPYLGDAVRLVESADADIEETDAALELGYGYPLGPFALLDTIGLDVSLLILRRLYAEFRQPDFAPPQLLEGLVRSGVLGRKNGHGFRSSLWQATRRRALS